MDSNRSGPLQRGGLSEGWPFAESVLGEMCDYLARGDPRPKVPIGPRRMMAFEPSAVLKARVNGGTGDED